MTDYGKLAYDECLRLKQRIDSLELKEKDNKYGELQFYSGSKVKKYIFNEYYKFNVLKLNEVNLNLSGNISGSNGHSQITIYINGFLFKTYYTSIDDFKISFSTTLDKGECVIKVEVLFLTGLYLNECNLSVFGAVAYKEVSSYVSAVNLTDKSVMAIKNDDELSLFLYDGNEISEKLSLEGVHIALSSIGDSIALAKITEDKTLKVYNLNLNDFVLENETIIDSNVYWLTGGKIYDKFCFYAVKGCRIFKYEISSDFSFVKIQLPQIASKVYSSPNIEGSFIYSDLNGLNKLVVQ